MKVLKCNTGEGWRRSDILIVWKMKWYIEAVNRGKTNWIGQIFDNREHKRDRKTERCAVDYVALLVNALSS